MNTVFNLKTPSRLPLALALNVCLLSPAAWASDFLGRESVEQYIDQVVSSTDLSREYVRSSLAEAKRLDSVLEAMSKPAERVLTWADYRPIFITDKRQAAGLRFWQTHAAILDRVSKSTGVPAEIIVAIIGVETFYGRYTGKHRVLDSLATLGFDYPRRASFFQRELTEFMQLAQEERLPLTELKGSYAGAMGLPQFIASSYRHYAVDGDGDGRRDLFENPADVIASVANYFVDHGWQRGGKVVDRLEYQGARLATAKRLATQKAIKPFLSKSQLQALNLRPRAENSTGLLHLEGAAGDEFYLYHPNFYVITRYNHSPMYAMAVLQLGQALRRAR